MAGSKNSRSVNALARLAWTAAALLAVVATLLLWQDSRDHRLIAQAALSLETGRSLTPAQRFEAYLHYAHDAIRKNRSKGEIPSRWVRLYYVLNPTHPGPADVLRWGSDYRGGCGSHVRVVVTMLQAAGMQARPLIVLSPAGKNIHTVVEGWVDGRWVVGDPLYGIAFRDRAGQLATVKELVADRPLFMKQVSGAPGYDKELYDYDQVTLFNWNKIPVLLPAVRRVLVLLLGEARVQDIVRPSLWMWPAEFWSLVCYLGAVVCALIGWLAGRSRRRAALRAS